MPATCLCDHFCRRLDSLCGKNETELNDDHQASRHLCVTIMVHLDSCHLVSFCLVSPRLVLSCQIRVCIQMSGIKATVGYQGGLLIDVQ